MYCNLIVIGCNVIDPFLVSSNRLTLAHSENSKITEVILLTSRDPEVDFSAVTD